MALADRSVELAFQAGRGATALVLSQAVTILAGLGTHAVCLRALGLADYGRFVTVNLLGLCCSLLLLSGIPQAVRLATAAEPGTAPEARRWIIRYHLPLTLGVVTVLLSVAPAVADHLGDPALVTPLWLTTAEVAARAGLFEPWVLLLNATGRQRAQAVVQAALAIARLAAVGALLAAGGGLVGAVTGLTLTALAGSAAAAAGLALVRGKVRSPTDHFRQRVLGAIRYTVGYDLFPFLLPGTSVWVLKAAGHDAEFVGFFSACVMLFTPLVALGAVVGAGVYPDLAKGFASGDRAAARAIASHAARVVLLAVALAAALTAARGADVARVLSGSPAGTGFTLRAVVVSSGCLGATLFFMEVLAARGLLGLRFRLMLGLTLAHAASTCGLAAAAGPTGVVSAMLLTAAAGAVVTAALTRGVVGPFLRPSSVARAAVAAAVAGFVLTLCPRPGETGAVLAQLATGPVVYFAALGFLGEVSRAELRLVSRWITPSVPRRGAAV
jgi:O-antigen/teichoic acid export membrane protein